MVQLESFKSKTRKLKHLTLYLYLAERSIFTAFLCWAWFFFLFLIGRPFIYNSPHVILIGMLLTIFTLLVAILFRNLYSAFRFIVDPFIVLRKFNTVEPMPDLINKINTMAKEEGIVAPTLLLTDEDIPIGSFGLGKDRSILLLQHEIVKSLNPKELEAVLGHEFYHIKNDIEKEWRDVFWLKYHFTPINFTTLCALVLPILLITLIAGILFPAPSDPEVIHLSPLTFYLYFYLPFVLVGMWISTMLFIFFIYTKLGGFKKPYISSKYFYIRELLADAYNILKMKETDSLFSALGKMVPILGLYSSGILRKKYFCDPNRLFSVKNYSIKDVAKEELSFRPLKQKIKDRLLFKLTLLQLMQKLMHEKVIVHVLDENLSKKHFPFPEPAFDILQRNRDRLGELMIHLKKAGSFNLIECASAMKNDPFEVFIMLVALINSKAVKIVV